MASRQEAWPDNTPGAWFVDRSCIDCGICRWVAPDTFGDADDHATVRAQPSPATARSAEEAAGRAAVACPVGSIGGPAAAIKAATSSFPFEVLPDVFFCGWAQKETYGAASWLVRRPEGNVLVDIPRPSPALMKRVAELGSLRWIVLSHKDDIAGHERWAEHFGAERWMHEADIGDENVENAVSGQEPVAMAPDLELVPVPGHTRGSMVLRFRDILFTGDHLWGRGPVGWFSEAGPLGSATGLGAGRSVCWHSWPQQIASMERLLDLDFRHVLPGHGRPWTGEAQPALTALVAWMRTV